MCDNISDKQKACERRLMELTLSPLTERMRSVCQSLYSRSGAHDFTFNPIPVRASAEAHDAVAIYKFEGFDTSLIFNSRIGGAQNVLECRVALASGERFVDFSLYDLMYLLNENDFKCYLFPYIDSPDRMEICLKVIFDGVMKYREQLSGIGGDEQLSQRAKNRKKKEMLRFFKHDIFQEVREQNDPILAWRLRSYREWYITRFCSRWYADYINGNYDRAAKRLGSFDSKCDYELRAYRFLQTLSAGASYTVTPSAANTFAKGNGLKSARSVSAFVIAFIIGTAVSFAGYTAAGYAAYFAIYHDALFCTALYDGWIPSAALLCAIPTGVSAAHLLWRRLLSKKERTAVKYAGLTASDTERRSRRGAMHTSVICSLIILVFAAKSGIAIYESGIVDNSSPFESAPLPFSEVREIYYEKETALYHLRFEGNRTFTCSENMAEEYILDHVDAEIKEIDRIKKTES